MTEHASAWENYMALLITDYLTLTLKYKQNYWWVNTPTSTTPRLSKSTIPTSERAEASQARQSAPPVVRQKGALRHSTRHSISCHPLQDQASTFLSCPPILPLRASHLILASFLNQNESSLEAEMGAPCPLGRSVEGHLWESHQAMWEPVPGHVSDFYLEH